MAHQELTQYIMNLSHDEFANVQRGTQYIQGRLSDLTQPEVDYAVGVFTAYKTSGLRAQSLNVYVTITEPRTLAGAKLSM